MWHSALYASICVGEKKGVYFLACSVVLDGIVQNVVKIGSTKDFRSRLSDYILHNPCDLYLVYFHAVFSDCAREMEYQFQQRFSRYQIRKTEWYYLEPIAKDLGLPWERMINEGI